MSLPPSWPASGGTPPPERGVFSNRTLNLRSIRAIGYDMDYTLIHYDVERVGGARLRVTRGDAFARARLARGGRSASTPGSVTRGLSIDLELGQPW